MGERIDMSNMEVILNSAHQVFSKEIEALISVKDALGEVFINIVMEIRKCKGKVIITGMGKSGHIARKISASLSSLGTCSVFVHPGEAMHGDLGAIQKQDVVIAISHSGESAEIVKIIPGINQIGAVLIGITGNPSSTLAKHAKICQIFPEMKEACHLGLAPSCSTTSALVYGDALAIVIAELNNFERNDFKVFHPAGALGNNLTVRVTDCMQRVSSEHILTGESTLNDVIKSLCALKSDILPVCVDSIFHGVVYAQNVSVKASISEIIKKETRYVNADEMAVDALRELNEWGIDTAVVLRDHTPVGIVNRENILLRGVVL